MKRKLLFAIGAFLCSVATWAQEDVTSTYLTNADFSATTPVTGTYLYGYGKDGTPYGFQAVDGWTSVVTNGVSEGGYANSGMAGGVFSYGSSTALKGYNKTAPATNPDGEATGKCFGFFGVWGCGGYYYQTVTLAAGAYTITVPMYNQSGTQANTTYTGFFPTSGTNNRTIAVNPTVGSWQNQTVSFTLDAATEGQIRIGYQSTGNGSSANPHIFIDCVKIECSPFATPADYTALNNAITTAKTITAFGFDAGEYAPYNVLPIIATAEAIDQNVNNSQADVQAVTAALNAITANAEEVNAFYDGNFDDAQSVTVNTCPKGWHGSDSHYTDGYWLRLMYSNGSSNTGLAHFSNSCAMLAKTTPRYGLDPAYALPLNADTYYKLSFDFAGWGGGNTGLKTTIVITDGSDNSITVNPAITEGQNQNGQSDVNAWKTYSGIFKTGDAGNYKLLLSKVEGDGSGNQITYGDMVMKTLTVAEATTYYNNLKNALDDDYEAEVYGGTEKTAFKDALDAAVPSTVAEIMAAAADLQTKHDTYVAAKPNYAKFIAEKNSAIAIGVTTEAVNAVTMSTKDDLETALQALYVLEDAAATSGYGVNATTLFGSWTTQNMDTKSGEHWSGDASRTYFDRWQNSGFTSSITSTKTLPAGKYVFKVAARAQEGGINGAFNMSVKVGDAAAVQKDFVAKSATGYGIETSGVANYSAEGTYANTTGRGWEWRFIGFELDESASVTMTAYAQILANYWVGFSDATLLTTSDNVGVLKNLLEAELTVANRISANVGTGAFQIPSSAVSTFEGAKTTAQGVYDNTDATSEQVSDAITALQTAEETYKNAELNAPADGAQYRIKSTAADGAGWKNLYYVLKKDPAQAHGGYSTRAEVPTTDVFYATAWEFVPVSGNQYKLRMTDADGAVRYLCTNIKGYDDGFATQIRTTTVSEKALVVKVIAATGTDGRWFLQNTEDNSYLGGQDAGLYSNSQNYDLAIEEASKASVTVSCKAGKYGTVIFPFTPDVSTGFDDITFYSCASVNGTTKKVQLEEVVEPAANTPYLIKNSSESNFSKVLTDWGTANADQYNVGLLTGVFKATEIEKNANNYVLQTPTSGEYEGVQGFYLVSGNEDYSFTATPNKAYLTYDAGGVKAFFLDFGNADAINDVRGKMEDGRNEIFNLAGQRVSKLQKGVNIVNGKKVLVK